MADGHAIGGQSVLKPVILSRGTVVVKDLARARHLYEEFFGFECVDDAPGRMLVRDRDPQGLRQRSGKPYWVMDVRVTEGDWQTSLFKHWGIDVASREEVERVHAYAVAHKDRLGIRNIRKPRLQHGTYSFYVEDEDGNWWEIECRRRARTTTRSLPMATSISPGRAEASRQNNSLDCCEYPSPALR